MYCNMPARPPARLLPLLACLQVPESTDDSPDLERFLQAATPQVAPPPTGAQDLTLVSWSSKGALQVEPSWLAGWLACVLACLLGGPDQLPVLACLAWRICSAQHGAPKGLQCTFLARSSSSFPFACCFPTLQADLWRWYEGPSTVGCEVTTIGGPRGPATAYYLPYLSAVQLLVPASATDEAAVVAAASGQPGCPAGQGQTQLLSYPNGLETWPERMRPLVQWGESANMRDRVPLHSRLLDVCGDAGDSHPLMATRIADLHPFTW